MGRLRSFKARNGRRIDLIHKRRSEGLTDAEAAELERHSQFVSKWIAERCPRDYTMIEEMEKYVDELRRRIELRLKEG